ncbi:LysR family transcriptional regulator [Streptomyces sp. NPDC059850]|uniref:LysR family transcriptional regulator n=1 Tax=Streptomyces sp. NPDC059850 TaxID=3346970 RepID=UPI0036570D14
MLTPPQLQAICEVVAAGSFRSAAQRLGYTPSAVSQQISTIERALGVALFERSPRSVRPTPAGLQLARRAGRLLADLSATENEMRAYAAAERGRLRLGSFWSAGFRLVPTVLTGFLRDRPEVDVRYEEGDPQVTVPAVVEGRLDLAVIFEYGVVPHSWPDGLDHTLVREEPLYVLLPAGHPLAGRRHIRLADLRDERWISYHEDTDAARCLRHICAAGGFLPEVLFRTNDYNLPYELVRQGLGVAIAPELAIADTSASPDASGTHLVRLTDPTHTRRVYATRRTSDPNPFLPQALALLHTAAAALPERGDAECHTVTG